MIASSAAAPSGGSAADVLALGFAQSGVHLVSFARSDPLPGGPLTGANLPDRVDVTIQAGAVDLFSLADVALTAATFALGDYVIALDDLAGRVVLTRDGVPGVTTVWSDGRFQADGLEDARFWGTVSLELAGGAFVTVGTVARADNPDHYVLDRLTITRGLAALIVTGVGAEAGDMTVAASLDGERVEMETSDGLVLVDGGPAGWRREDGMLAADAWTLALTAPGGEYGPDSNLWSAREFGRVVAVFNRILVDGLVSGHLSRATNWLSDNAREESRDSAVRRAGERDRAVRFAADQAAWQHDLRIGSAAFREDAVRL